MTSVLVNAGGAASGGGVTWLQAVLEELAERGSRDLDWTFIVTPSVALEMASSVPDWLKLVPQRRTGWRRVLWEQTALAARRRRDNDGVLVSAANFGPVLGSRRSILVAHNRLHFDPPIAGLGGVRFAVEAALARASVRRATVTLTATESMTRAVRNRTGREATCLMFGPGRVRRHVPGEPGRTVFAHRTQWGPHKRLGDLLLAVRDLARTHSGRFKLVSACDPRTEFARRFPQSRAERELLGDPAVEAHLELGDFGRSGQEVLHGDAVVMPSVTESFCFPLAEAVALRIPVVAAESEFARELCGDQAFFVTPGEPTEYAQAMRRVIHGERPTGDIPPPSLSWSAYVDELARMCRAAAGPQT